MVECEAFWLLECRYVESCEILCRVGVDLVWFDSLGAKSAAIRVRGVLVYPGAAAMQPSYPLPSEEKQRLRSEAVKAIEARAAKANTLIITHYHYDHHLLPSRLISLKPCNAILPENDTR